MLSPRKPRSRKVQKGRQRGQVQSYNFVFGRYAIQVTKAGQISARLLETCRRTLSRTFQRRGKICLLYTSPSPRDRTRSRMPSSA